MITDVDIKKMKKVFATKEDLKKFATKDDLKKFITKEDFKVESKKFATKEDLEVALEKYATKDDLLNVTKELKNDILDFKDSILHEIIKLREDITVVIGYSDRIEDHDQRIEKLETAVYQ
ncbi:hypothetical protein HZA75_00045 [Candidatus Roizmanbacteria bacterium]|nr:hypothetical protein [Candidatus Roizmanbacteria bacterium]